MWIADSSHQGASGCLINIFRTMIVGDAPRVENSVIDHLIRTQPSGSTIPEICSVW